jgi:hypothetical protein
MLLREPSRVILVEVVGRPPAEDPAPEARPVEAGPRADADRRRPEPEPAPRS